MKEQNQIVIYQSEDGISQLEVSLQDDTLWLTQIQLVDLFDSSKANISEHIKHIFQSGELSEKATVRKFRTVQNEGNRKVTRNRVHYNLDVIISVGYRVNSIRGTQFRIWANRILKDYLVQGYAINEKRLAQQNQKIEYLKTGIRILNRAIEEQMDTGEYQLLKVFAKGLELLDDYDHERLDVAGKTKHKTIFPEYEDYMKLISTMYADFESDVFALPKDESFHSSINQIKQGFDGKDFYPTIEEKAANLLYYIIKNHSFIDGNKRIAAACFIYFLQQNNALMKTDATPILDNETLAALTLFIATSKTEEANIVKQLVVSILNRNKEE
ncbi:MAG: virulence protein RhuM/Fic/DOC family protein [Saprospiraceae bacterium]